MFEKRTVAFYVLAGVLIPLGVGVLFWFLGYGYITKSQVELARETKSLVYTLMGWVGATVGIQFILFIRAIWQAGRTVTSALDRVAEAEESLGEQVTKAVAPHLVRLATDPSKLRAFTPMANELTRRSLEGAFSDEGYVRCYGVSPEDYCRLLKQACGVATESIAFTCLESPYWFMLTASRQVHLQALNDSALPRDRKTRVVILPRRSEEHLLHDSPPEFAEHNPKALLEAIVGRDQARWSENRESEIRWFEKMNSDTTLLWTLEAKLGSAVPEGAIRDFGIFDGTFYLSYNFDKAVLSCAWDPQIVDRFSSVIEAATQEGAVGTTFLTHFCELPGVPMSVREQYRAELTREE